MNNEYFFELMFMKIFLIFNKWNLSLSLAWFWGKKLKGFQYMGLYYLHVKLLLLRWTNSLLAGVLEVPVVL